jgi:hypothetical protein
LHQHAAASANLPKGLDCMHRRDKHQRDGGEFLRRKVGFVSDHPARRDLHVLGIAAPAVCSGREVARRFILRCMVPLRRVGREARNHDDPVSERKSLDLGAKLLDVADHVRADHVRKRAGSPPRWNNQKSGLSARGTSESFR